ncbi:MAG: thioredoxin family protein [Flavobacteriaceae bacterium]|nr:thioredoxin family protein [Flavobacteriaceae bacterium]
MKNLFTILFILVSTASLLAQDTVTSNLNWLTNLEKAKKEAKKTKKPILVYFTGSDWCAPCIKLKEDFFNSKEFIDKSDKLILVLIDKPFRVDIISEKQLEYNNKIISKYNPKKTFPKMLILNSKGKVLDEMAGYSYYGDTSNHFDFINRNI